MSLRPATADASSLTADLQNHLVLCEEVLDLISREGEALRDPAAFPARDFADRRSALLPRLSESLDSLRRVRETWQQLDPATRARHAEADVLMRRNQDLIMRIIVLDRENEQALLRRGLVPPEHLPSSHRQRPHAVAQRYLKNLPSEPPACPSSESSSSKTT